MTSCENEQLLFLSISLLLLLLLLLLSIILVEILSLLAELYSARLREILVVTSAPQDNQCEMTFFALSGDRNLCLMTDFGHPDEKKQQQSGVSFSTKF